MFGRIAAGDVLPGIRAQLLEAQRNARTLAVELEDAHFDFLADLHDFGRMLDALPRHVGDVQQAIDAAEIDECAVVGEVLDRALHDRAFLQVVHQRAALGGEFLLHDGAARHDHVVALLVELDDLEFERLVSRYAVSRTGRTSTSEPGRNARTFSSSTVKPPFTRPVMMPVTISDSLNAFSRRVQVRARLAFSRDSRVFAVAVFDGIQRHFDFIAGDDFDLAALIAELVEGDDGFGLEADVHDDHVVAYADDPAGEDHAWANALIRQALFEHLAERFGHVSTRCVRWASHPKLHG